MKLCRTCGHHCYVDTGPTAKVNGKESKYHPCHEDMSRLCQGSIRDALKTKNDDEIRLSNPYNIEVN